MKRNIKTFEADLDVVRMLDRASKEGIKMTHILNQGARRWLTRKGFSRKKDLSRRERVAA